MLLLNNNLYDCCKQTAQIIAFDITLLCITLLCKTINKFVLKANLHITYVMIRYCKRVMKFLYALLLNYTKNKRLFLYN